MSRGDCGRGSDRGPTLAARIQAAKDRPHAVAVVPIWRGRRCTVLNITFRSQEPLAVIVARLDAQPYNAQLTVTDGPWVEWVISEPINEGD